MRKPRFATGDKVTDRAGPLLDPYGKTHTGVVTFVTPQSGPFGAYYSIRWDDGTFSGSYRECWLESAGLEPAGKDAAVRSRIRWEPTEYGGLTGHVHLVDPWLFQIWKPDRDCDDWLLSSVLPGQFNRVKYAATRDQLKPEAEELLREFAASLGVTFADGVS